jgi:DNA (cytosine-5)-methyltransferase 1
MVEYTCNKCGKIFKTKGRYNNHINKKNPCITENKLEEYKSDNEEKDIRYTVSDFFCGAGGFSEGFHQAGFNVVFSLDNWAPAIKTHDLNHPNCKAVLKNILELDTPEKIDSIVPDTDIIIGSPPCVSFSTSNKSGKADKTLGIKLINQFLKIVLWKINKGTCKYWIMENVPASINYVKDVYTWKELNLPGEGPDLKVPVKQTLIASNYGAPQDRKRAVCGNYPIPQILEKKINIIDVFNMLGPPLNNNLNSFKDIIYGEEYNNITDHLYDTEIRECDWMEAKKKKTDHGYMGKMSFPDNVNRSSRTVMATMSYSTRESIIFNKENCPNKYRGITIREASCFMGYPINYQFEGNNDGVKYKLIGNSVCPPMAKELGIAILNKDKLKIKEPIPRDIKPASLNLNGRILELKQSECKQYSSKYHVHVPYLKMCQYRVELDNLNSDIFKQYYNKQKVSDKLKEQNIEFNKNEKAGELINKLLDLIDNPFEWNVYIHKGAGKTAAKYMINHIYLKPYLNDIKLEELLDEFSKYKFKDALTFQKAHCNIDNSHISPNNLLNNIKILVDKYSDDSNITIDDEECNNLFNVDKIDIPKKIILAQYLIHYFLNN